jgi:serine protease Do
MTERTAQTPRWYDRVARVLALVAVGMLIAQVLPDSDPDDRSGDVPRQASPPVQEAAVGLPPAPVPAALPTVPLTVHPALDALEAGANIPDVAEAVLPSVVSIRASSRFVAGGGSGVIVAGDGVVLTNNHVVEGARDLTIQLHDGREFPGKVVGTDPKSDLAVVKVAGAPSGDLVPLPFGDSDQLRIGEPVLAVGNPFGMSGSVTMGIVSAMGRAHVVGVDYEDFIQTDAAINPGNSGGALVNTRGELVGINTAILSGSGGSQGIGLAIPASLARPVAESLLETGRVERAWLGVVITDADARTAADGPRGAIVREVVGDGPAAKAGLRVDDMIVSVDGVRVETSSRLRTTVAHRRAGRRITVEFVREGVREQREVVLGLLPDEEPPTSTRLSPWRK